MSIQVFETLVVGPLQVNCYLAGDPETRDAVCIDPGDEAARILAAIRRRGLTVKGVLITHAHADHILAAPEVGAATGAPVMAPDGEQDLWSQAEDFCAFFGIEGQQPADPDRWIRAGETLDFGTFALKALDVRGHAPAALAYVGDGLVFTGDALFCGSIGRTDMPGQDHATLIDTINRNLLCLPPETQVYPGHGRETTIGREARENPFLRDVRGGGAPRGGSE